VLAAQGEAAQVAQVFCLASNVAVWAGGQHVLAMLDPIYEVPLWLTVIVFIAALVAATELGFRQGRKSYGKADPDTKSWVTMIVASVLGVLGLLLAFTMNMAVTRYDSRRLLVVEEANAIGTSYWRAQLVPPPEGPELLNLLREYTEVRIQFSAVPRVQFLRGEDREVNATHERSGQLQGEIWSRAAAYAQKDPRSVTAGLLLQTLNQTFDLEAARWAAYHAHVPASVIWADCMLALLAALLVGYGLGLSGHRNFFHVIMLAVCITVVMVVILDLDDPRHGFIRVGYQSLLDVQRQMGPPTR
jgi:hypothetical protein